MCLTTLIYHLSLDITIIISQREPQHASIKIDVGYEKTWTSRLATLTHKYSDTEFVTFYNVATSFVFEVRNDLP